MNSGFFMKSFGCSANKSDTELMIGLLERAGYRQTSLNEARYILINTCGVKQATEDRVIHVIKQLASLNKKMIIAGCLSRINQDRIRDATPNFSAIIDPKSIHRILDVIDKINLGQKGIVLLSEESQIKPCLPKSSLNPITGIVQISEGCNMACSYCCTKLARLDLFCYPNCEIKSEVDRFLAKGCMEIWLTSQDNSAYNYKGFKLPGLISEICQINGNFFVRNGMMNPLHTKSILNDLIISYGNKKIYKFLHLPLQSASDRILHLMRRGYSSNLVLEIVEKFNKFFSFLNLSTDIIVGFPTEENVDFDQTVEFLYKIKPDIVNVSKFGLRPNTEAKEFKQLPRELINKRCKKLVEIVKNISYEKNSKWLGWNGKCLIDEKGKIDGSWVGRNSSYKPIVLKSNKDLMGKILNVEVVDYSNTSLYGTNLSDN